ncbi:hypothetical protein DUNSADRAFT_2155 [Dunaliella salina]|nr:hypothetical protein DUNSADRAFT_2155 [Dunaliella salina]|eukprot:KAF5843119.1 hypothetical protein DUNSADRAFT_2155 [Dunaliella salina]
MINIHHLRWLLGLTSLLCTAAFVAYCSHQALAPIAARKADVECRLRHLRYNVVRSISYYANRYGGILLPGSLELNVPAMERIFQAEQQRNQFHARYGHVEHVAEHLLRQWEGARTGGVTMLGFITHLKEWFAEKERRFVVDFPTAKPSKAIRRAGATKFWLLTYKAPDDYQELLMQHKAKRDAAAAAAASKGAKRKQSPALLVPSGVGGLVQKQKGHEGRDRAGGREHQGLAEPLLGSAQGNEEPGFSFDGERHLDRSLSGPTPIPAAPSARAASHQSLTIAPDHPPNDVPSPSDQASQLSAAGAGITAVPAPESPLQHVTSQDLDRRSTSSLPVLADGSVSPTQLPQGSLAATLQHPSLHQPHAPAHSTRLDPITTQQHNPDVEAGSTSPTSSMEEAENLLAQLEDQLTVGQSVGGVAATWEAIRCWGCGLLGFLLCVAFAGPFIRSTGYASSALGVHPFLVAFLVGPLASHVPNIISSVRHASSKQPRNMSVALGQVYGSVTMINTLVFGVLLGVMACQHIRWKYTGELIIALLPTLLVGSVGASSRTISTLWGLALLSLYPVVIFLCWLVRSKLK